MWAEESALRGFFVSKCQQQSENASLLVRAQWLQEDWWREQQRGIHFADTGVAKKCRTGMQQKAGRLGVEGLEKRNSAGVHQIWDTEVVGQSGP